MIHQLRFDVTDADTLADSANVGANVRAGTDGTLIGSQNLAAQDWLNVASVLYDETGTPISAANPLDVSATINFSFDYAEDSPASSGDIGAFVLSVRQDTLASSTSADGDYAAFKVNALGELYVHDTSVLAQLASGITVNQGTSPWVIGDGGGSITVDANNLDIRDLVFATDKVDVSGSAVSITGTVAVTQSTSPWVVSDAALANTAVTALATAVDNTAGGTDLGADLANRKYIFIANEGNKKIFIGPSGLTSASGFPLAPGSMIECRAGAAINLFGIGSTAAPQDIRILQLS